MWRSCLWLWQKGACRAVGRCRCPQSPRCWLCLTTAGSKKRVHGLSVCQLCQGSSSQRSALCHVPVDQLDDVQGALWAGMAGRPDAAGPEHNLARATRLHFISIQQTRYTEHSLRQLGMRLAPRLLRSAHAVTSPALGRVTALRLPCHSQRRTKAMATQEWKASMVPLNVLGGPGSRHGRGLLLRFLFFPLSAQQQPTQPSAPIRPYAGERRESPAAERNKQPILEVLQSYLLPGPGPAGPGRPLLLEVLTRREQCPPTRPRAHCSSRTSRCTPDLSCTRARAAGERVRSTRRAHSRGAARL